MKKRDVGLSIVLSSVILTAVIGLIVFVAFNVASDAINNQIEESQFDQAKNVVVALDKLIKRIMYKPESSGYIKTSFWTTHPYFTNTGNNLTIKVDDVDLLDEPINANIIRIKGGSSTSVSEDINLVGTSDLLLTDVSSSVGRVYLNQSLGAWITLEYNRVRIINAGTMQYYNGTGYEPHNSIEITLIDLDFGDIDIKEQSSFVVRNMGLFPQQHEIAAGNLVFKVQYGDLEQTVSLVEDLGGNSSYKTLINIVTIRLQLSILGEG